MGLREPSIPPNLLHRNIKMASELSTAFHFFPRHRFSVGSSLGNCWAALNKRRATSGLKLNLSEILQLGKLWGSTSMIQAYNNFIEPTNDANAGNLVGNRNFYNNDYMVCWNTNRQSNRCDASLGPAWSGLRLHAENVFNTVAEHRMHQLSKRWYPQPSNQTWKLISIHI